MFAFLKKPACVMAIALLAYVCAFYVIHVFLGRGMTIAVVLPVVAAAWCFGVFWGIIAAFLSAFVTMGMCRLFGIDWVEQLFIQGAAFTGTAAMVVLAAVIGSMREMSQRLQHTIAELSREVEERRDAEAGLREFIQFSDNILESSIDSIVVCDETGTVVSVNRALCELSAYSRDDLIGESPQMILAGAPGEYQSVTGESIRIDESYAHTVRSMHADLFETGRIMGWEHFIFRSDARLVPVEGTISMLRDTTGELTGSLSIIRDISARRAIEREIEQHRAHLHDLVQAKTAQLQAREQELQAINQQLSAANQQLHAANEQLRASEQALRESEERFRAVVQLANEAIVVIDSQGVIVSWNRGAEKIYGHAPHNIIGRTVFALVPEDRRQTHECMFATKNGRNDLLGMQTVAEGTGLRRDGGVFPVEFSITCWEHYGQDSFAFIVRDITARKKTEEDLLALNEQLRERNDQLEESRRALEQSEQQFRILVETMNEGLLVCDQQGRFSYVNDRLCGILGYEREELLGSDIDMCLPEQSRALLREQMAQQRAGAYRPYEMTWLRRDGTPVIASVSPRPIFDAQKRFEGSFAVITDITRQKQLQQQRREARDFFENIFRMTNDGIVVSDISGRIVRVNTTIETMLGYAEHELIGVSLFDVFFSDQDFTDQQQEIVEGIFEHGSAQNWETEWRRKDGSRCAVEISISFLRDSEGNATGAVAAVRDITRRREIEQQLLQAEKLKSLGGLAGGVAHDFNNVLAAILGRAQLLKRMLSAGLQPEDSRGAAEILKGLSVIEHAALDGSQTVRRIQDFSRAGAEKPFFGSADMVEIIAGALEFTRVRWKDDAEVRGVRYHIDNTVCDFLPVVGNAPELREVFTNLINNALDAMPQGGTLGLSAQSDPEERTVTITVQDTGAGIPRSIMNRIFDPFFTTKGPQSTGLGMSVSYGIIRRHKGTISVHSEDGGGAVFTIVLPLGEPMTRRRSDRRTAEQAAGLRVLVIDDDEDVREVLAEVLINAGHTVQSASDGEAGLDLFRAEPHDLVFTDLGMPGMSGWDVARDIRQIRPRTLIAMVTGWDVQCQKENIEQHGIDFVVNKPFQVAHVMEVVSMAHGRLNGKY